MPSDPEIALMDMDDAVQSVMVLNPEELFSPVQIKALTVLIAAAAHPVKIPREQVAMAVQWALWTRAQDMLLQLVLAQRMTVFPQADGSMKFGGKLMKIDEAAAKAAHIEASKILREKAPEEVAKVEEPKVVPTEEPTPEGKDYEAYMGHVSLCDGCAGDQLCAMGVTLKTKWLGHGKAT